MHKAFTKKKTKAGITEYHHKKNGLRVLLYPNKAMPLVGVMVTYEVGSRHEAVGHTGSTHLLEHLMFKGSKHFNKKKGNHYDTVLENIGGLINATTWNDRTNYYAVVPKEYIQDVIAPEADRMRNASFVEKDREDEMPAVRSEFEIGENDPETALYKDIWATAYQAHPYHHNTIGWKDDIENVSIERLRRFYDTYYWPNNATVTIAGDFQVNSVLSDIDSHFGAHPSSPNDIPQTYTNEPHQQGRRHVDISRSGNTNLVAVAHKIPEALHKDSIAIQVLASVLGDGKQSRLYKALVETGKATDVDMMAFLFRDTSLMHPFVYLTQGTAHDNVRDTILHEYEQIQKRGITDIELKSAQAHVKTAHAKSRDGLYNTLSAINESIAIGDWTFYTTYQSSVENITKKDVQRVAQTYLRDNHMTTGYFYGV